MNKRQDQCRKGCAAEIVRQLSGTLRDELVYDQIRKEEKNARERKIANHKNKIHLSEL